MKVLNLNVNDFGGADRHIEEYKKKYGGRYLSLWDKINKTKEIEGIEACVDKYLPDIVIFQEYDINSKEAFEFTEDMKRKGYVLKAEKQEYKRPSMTVFFIRDNMIDQVEYINVGHSRNGRAYAIRIKDIVIYGTHIPPKYDADFWSELHSFIRRISSEKYLLVGDFNTINYKNRNEFIALLNNAVDIWKEKGNENSISMIGDYVLSSPNMDINGINITSFDEGFSDHPGVYVNVTDIVSF